MQKIFRFFLLYSIVIPALAAAQGLDTLQLKTIFDVPYLPGIRPEFVAFSPDEDRVFFHWNDSSMTQRKQYSVNLSGENLEETDGDESIGSLLSPNGKMLAFNIEGELWISDSNGENKRLLESSQSKNENPVWSPDSRQLAFIREGDVWITSVTGPLVRQLTKKKEDEPDFRIRHWSGDGKYLILTQHDTSEYWDLYNPQYIHKFVEPGHTRRGQALITVSSFEIDSLRSRELLKGVIYLNNITANKSGTLLAIDHMDKFLKEREVTVFDLENKTQMVIFKNRTDGWIYPPLSRLDFAPNDDKLLLTSEQDGFSHVYTLNPDGSEQVQHSQGEYEVSWAVWKDDQTIVYASTAEGPGERHIYTFSLDTGDTRKFTQDEGYRYDFNLSPDRRYLVYHKTYWNEPADLHLLDLDRPEHKENQITESVPGRFTSINWQTPEYIRYPSRDGERMISMSVLKPVNFEPNQKYPVIVFAHGSGSLQNVFKGWSINFFREYMFNQYLNKHGYVVVEVDFRHSTGYGREFREDVTNRMGYYETNDIIDALDYLDTTGGFVDLDRVGIYGGSYGGFLALYAVSLAPERFHVAAALRAVTNWENYYYANPWYAGARLGHPDENPGHYKRSSPLTYADSLTRPVLLLHGLIDDNVGFQDAMQYINRLMQSGNHDFELMVYPSEGHAFKQQESWYDKYSRIDNFFERHLKRKKEMEPFLD
ncbi:MAG: alpha/beta fold hydrolase [Balneolales bacterium]